MGHDECDHNKRDSLKICSLSFGGQQQCVREAREGENQRNFAASILLWSLSVCAMLCVHKGRRRTLAVLFYNALPYSLETGFLTEHGAG